MKSLNFGSLNSSLRLTYFLRYVQRAEHFIVEPNLVFAYEYGKVFLEKDDNVDKVDHGEATVPAEQVWRPTHRTRRPYHKEEEAEHGQAPEGEQALWKTLWHNESGGECYIC